MKAAVAAVIRLALLLRRIARASCGCSKGRYMAEMPISFRYLHTNPKRQSEGRCGSIGHAGRTSVKTTHNVSRGVMMISFLTPLGLSVDSKRSTSAKTASCNAVHELA